VLDVLQEEVKSKKLFIKNFNAETNLRIASKRSMAKSLDYHNSLLEEEQKEDELLKLQRKRFLLMLFYRYSIT